MRNAWTRGARNLARVVALGALSSRITEACEWLTLGRSAICAADAQGQNACVSWDGGWQSMKGCVTKADLDSAVRYFGGGRWMLTHFLMAVLCINIQRDTIGTQIIMDGALVLDIDCS